MKILSWNVRGLGNPQAFQTLHKLVQEIKPQVIFIVETKLSELKCKERQLKLGFENGLSVGAWGNSGGLCLLWKEEIDLSILSYNSFHIDSIIKENGVQWRLLSFYGDPDSTKDEEFVGAYQKAK